MAEVRVKKEGSFRTVQASGSGRTWATAATPTSGLWAFVESFSYTSANRITTINERGVPDHHKHVGMEPIDLTLNCKWTGNHRAGAPATASGATLPLEHGEFRASATEVGAGSGYYMQFHGMALTNQQFTENEEGNTIQLTYRCLAMNGPTGSGYLS